MKTFLSVAGTVVGILAMLYLGLFALFDGMSTGRVVGIVLIGIVALAVGILLTLAIVYRLSVDRRTRMVTEHTAPAIDAQWHELATYRPPHVYEQLPEPRVITVPRFSHNGAAMPYNMPAQPVPILRTMANDVELQVPLNYLQRFLGLSTPARSEWTGKRELYSSCMVFCDAHGLLVRDAKGGAVWKPEYGIEARRAWCEQFDHYPIDAGGAGPGAIGQR